MEEDYIEFDPFAPGTTPSIGEVSSAVKVAAEDSDTDILGYISWWNTDDEITEVTWDEFHRIWRDLGLDATMLTRRPSDGRSFIRAMRNLRYSQANSSSQVRVVRHTNEGARKIFVIGSVCPDGDSEETATAEFEPIIRCVWTPATDESSSLRYYWLDDNSEDTYPGLRNMIDEMYNHTKLCVERQDVCTALIRLLEQRYFSIPAGNGAGGVYWIPRAESKEQTASISTNVSRLSERIPGLNITLFPILNTMLARHNVYSTLVDTMGSMITKLQHDVDSIGTRADEGRRPRSTSIQARIDAARFMEQKLRKYRTILGDHSQELERQFAQRVEDLGISATNLLTL